MAIQNSLNLTATGIITADGAGVYTGSTVTQFGTVIAGTSNSVSSVAPSATVGVALVSAGAASNPIFGTTSIGGGGTGSTSFTAGSVVFSNGTILTEDNSNLFWDDTNNRLGINTNTPQDSIHVVDGVCIEHTATESDDHALELIIDAAGFGDVKGMDIVYTTGAMTSVQDEEAILLNIDESASVGGIFNGYEVLSTSEGSATVNGYTTGINVNPVVHSSGIFGDADNILNKAVDVTAALASGGAGAISIFVADNDTFTVGDAATWDEFEIILDTGASGAGVAPTFEYSTGGAAYSSFSPADGTNGFRNTGTILWDSSTLAGWATATSGDFEIRITRTRNTLSTTPIIDELQISSTTEFKWDKNGDVNFNSLTLATALAVANGGTGASTITGVLTGNGTSAITGNAVTQYGTVIAGASNAVSSVAPSATSGVPFISQGAASNPVFGTAVVAGGGTGLTSATAYAVLCGGTTSTAALQSIASVGTSGQVLTSNGAAALPTFQAAGGGSGGFVFISTTAISSDATVEFINLSSTYSVYVVVFDSVLPATDNVNLYLRMSDDNGVTWESGSSAYRWNNIERTGGTGGTNDTSDAQIDINTGTMGNISTEAMNGMFYCINPSNTEYTSVVHEHYYIRADSTPVWVGGGGQHRAASAIDGIQFFYSSGNLASGNMTLYGIEAS